MINPRLYRWPDLSRTIGLLLFAQRVQECLFDYTLDSYKAPALNTHTRCKEVLRALDDVEAGTLVRASVEAIVAELAHSITIDSAAKQLLGVHAPIFGDQRRWSTSDLPALRVQVEMVKSYLAGGAYERELVKQLKVAMPSGKEKDEILALTTDLVVELMDAGFSRDYIYSHAKGFFFGVGGPTFNDVASFDEFLKAFAERQPKKYQVCVRLSQGWADLNLNEDLPKEVMEVFAAAPTHRQGLRLERAFLAQKHDGIYGVMTLEALDPKSARNRANNSLAAIGDIGACHTHRSPLAWDGEMLVWEGEHPRVLKKPLAAIHKQDECSRAELPTRVRQTLAALGAVRVSPESWSRVSAALALHSSAVRSEDVAVQLSTLWAALEALFAASADEAKITAVSDSLVPCLCRGYVGKLLCDLDESLSVCCQAAYKKALAGLPAGKARIERLAAIIAINANEPLRDIIYPALNNNPLLRHRVFTLKKALSSADGVRELLERHEQRVIWHLRRIYRSRNLLLHSGKRVPYRDALVENLHAYFHALLTGLETQLNRVPGTRGVDVALLQIRMDHEQHLRLLKAAKGVDTSVANLTAFLFGPAALPLAE